MGNSARKDLDEEQFALEPQSAGEGAQSTYEAIRRLIREGRFKGGQPLRAAEIAALLGVSRTPVRDVLARLAAEGVVELLPNRGARLLDISRQDVQDIFDLRSLLEPYGAARAATQASDEDIAELVRMAEEIEGYEYSSQLGTLNDEFHTKIASMSGSRVLQAVLPAVVKEPLMHRLLQGTSADMTRHRLQHREIIEAIQSRNPRWAESAMRAHVEFARQLYHELTSDS